MTDHRRQDRRPNGEAGTAERRGTDDERRDATDTTPGWPVDLAGVTETVVTTLGPNGRWNAAALGLFAPDEAGEPVTATTWGNTRTRRNFHREGGGYVQFVSDPIVFVDAALSIVEYETPVLDAADAWAEISATCIDDGEKRGTHWEQWKLDPIRHAIVAKRVPTIDRGFAAVVEASVVASRLGVAGYDDETLTARLEYFDSVVDRAGSERERTAFDRLHDHLGDGTATTGEDE